MYKIDEDYFNDETDDNDEKRKLITERTFLDEARAKTFVFVYICFQKE